MEDTLRANIKLIIMKYIIRLNPCFNGRYSQRFLINDTSILEFPS